MSRPSTASIRGSVKPDFKIWYGGFDHDWGTASIEGGDVMPVGDGVVFVGQGERSTAKAVSILAQNMFAAGAARLVIGAMMPRERAAMHLDTVFTFCDRNLVTIYEPVVTQILPIMYRPDGNGGVTAQLSERSFLDEVRRRTRASPTCGSSPRAATSSRRSATSGMTVTTWSRWGPVKSSATSATRRPTPSWPPPGSSCTQSPARNLGVAAAAATA